MDSTGLMGPLQLEILYDSMKNLSSLSMTTYCLCALYIWIQTTDVIRVTLLRLTEDKEHMWSDCGSEDDSL